MMEELAYQVKLDVFEGPFDLLLKAIDDGKIDVHHVCLFQITAAYLDYWKSEEPNLLIAADFLYMAAYLVELKSKGLLPYQEEPAAAEIGKEIEASLVRHIEEFSVYKKVALGLKERKAIFGRFYPRHEGEAVEGEIELVDVSLRDLVLAFQKVYSEAARRESVTTIKAEEVTLDQRLAEIKQMLSSRENGLPFEELFLRMTRIEVVVTFLAILELAKQAFIRISQEGRFGSIIISRVGVADGIS